MGSTPTPKGATPTALFVLYLPPSDCCGTCASQPHHDSDICSLLCTSFTQVTLLSKFGKSLLRREQTKVCTLPRSFTLPVKSIYIIFNKLLSTTKKKKIFLHISLLAPVREPLLSFHTWRGSASFSVIQLKVAIPGPEQSSCVCSSAKHCLLDLGFSGPAQGWGTFKVGALCIWSGPKWQCKVVPFDFDICQAPLFSPLCSPPSFCSRLILPAALHRYQGAFDFSL